MPRCLAAPSCGQSVALKNSVENFILNKKKILFFVDKVANVLGHNYTFAAEQSV